ncbi:MAG: restriction endonuclease subunit S [Oxalobacteraceae bacterium]|nr:restriction endonuclease subunit S [Oxalobacteraceae bacterium]
MSNAIPDGWSYSTLSDVAEIDAESLKTSTDPDFRFKYIDIASVSTGKIERPSETIKFSESPSRARRKLKSGDIVMSTVRPNLKAFAYFECDSGEYVASTGFSVLRAKNGNSGRFIFNAILSDGISRQIDALVVGSNYPAINSSDVKNLEILKPTDKEQQKIAAILTAVDDVIESIRAQINKLKDLKTGMMQELLTKGIGHTEFKDSPVGRIPTGWDAFRLKDITIQIRDGNYGADYPTSSEMLDSGVPFLTSSVVGNDQQINLAKLKYISEEKHKQLAKAHIQKDDVLFTNRGANVGNVAIVPNKLDDANIGPQLTFLRIDKNVTTSLFLYIALQSDYFKKQLSQFDSGSAMNFFGIGTTENFIFAIPTLDEQKKIASSINSILTKIQLLSVKLYLTQNTKKALMQDLLTGKVRVKVEESLNSNNREYNHA